jgi:hypothetical protein
MFDLREQPGVRIGVVISDDRTMVYAPVSRNVEAGSTTDEKPNAIMLNGSATENLAAAAGASFLLTTPAPQGAAREPSAPTSVRSPHRHRPDRCRAHGSAARSAQPP